jgi:3-hydroxymyristoyl/3-hydroxydecanoyl-(acyl carrier protein) dehydratase
MELPLILQIDRPQEFKRQIQLRLEPTLPCFQGHFPMAPVLAGVVQLDWVMTLAAREFPVPLVFCGMQSVKFLNLTHPPVTLTLTLTLMPERGLLNFIYQDTERTYSSGTIRVARLETAGER